MIEIRRIRKADLVAVAAIYADAVEAGVQTGHLSQPQGTYWEEWMQIHSVDLYPAWVAIKDNVTVGWISLSSYRNGREAFKNIREVSYYIHTAHFRAGIASGLLSVASAYAIKSGVKCLLAIVISGNEPSIRFLEKNGFEVWGTLPAIVESREGVFSHCYYGKNLQLD